MGGVFVMMNTRFRVECPEKDFSWLFGCCSGVTAKINGQVSVESLGAVASNDVGRDWLDLCLGYHGA